MDLASQLDAFRTGWEARVGDATAAMIADDLVALRDTGILDRAARAGDRLPPADHLVDALGRPFDLAGLVAAGPVVITFYRGGWCPYCNLELRAYQAALPEILAAGGTLVAISPELPDHSLSTAEKNDLTFPVLSDVGGGFADALGIRFALSQTVQPFYEKAGHALPSRNGDGSGPCRSPPRSWSSAAAASPSLPSSPITAAASNPPRPSPPCSASRGLPRPEPLHPTARAARPQPEDAMTKVAIVIYSKLEGAGKSAVYRALMFADELMRGGDDVTIVFDGAGSTALADVLDPANSLHRTWLKAAPALRGVCAYCAKSYGVHEALTSAGIPMLTEDKGHASLRGLLLEGRQIITF